MSKRERVGPPIREQAPAEKIPLAGEYELDDAGHPEPTILEVERMLEASDRGETPTAEPLSPLSEDARLDLAIAAARDEHTASFVATDLPHALDLAPVNSKIVVVLEENKPLAILAGPNGAEPLPAHDIAHRLPAGARITKHANDRYEATQLSPAEHRASYTTASAVDAITRFIDYFHPLGGSR